VGIHETRHLIVVYHEDCIDGLAAAWAFDKKWGRDENVHLSYIPYGHHNIPEAEEKIRKELSAGAEVFFADVAPKKAFLDELMAPLTSGLPPAKSIHVMDHHKSAADELTGYTPPADTEAPKLSIHIDAEHPAASNMIWDMLLPGETKPDFLAMIAKMDLARDIKSDHDLAAAALIDSKCIKTVADAFHNFEELSGLKMHDMVVAGLNILSDQENRIDKLTDNIMYTRITLLNDKMQEESIWVPVINADVQNFGRHISDYLREQGDRTGLGMAFAWYVQGNGTVTMSIRSDGDPDASLIAQVLRNHPGVAGGGHKTSAAVHFTSLQQFMDIIPLHTEAQMNQLKKKDFEAERPVNDDKPPPRIAASPLPQKIYPRFRFG
jgi:hypothetical protein